MKKVKAEPHFIMYMGQGVTSSKNKISGINHMGSTLQWKGRQLGEQNFPLAYFFFSAPKVNSMFWNFQSTVNR